MGIEAIPLNKLNELIGRAATELADISSLQDLAKFKVVYLGKKSELVHLLKSVGGLEPKERAELGKAVNEVKTKLVELIKRREDELEREYLAKRLATETIDVSLPGRKQQLGSIHPVTRVEARFREIFDSMGFIVVEGPEIEEEYYNFTALNIPDHHPARADHDTFYFSDGLLLRTHTSPVQIRYMENNKPPLRIIVPGKVYRCDYDATHTPMFHQLEGLFVDQRTNFAELKSLLISSLEAFFEEKVEIRMRPSYFPFTEPSAEVDFRCISCRGGGAVRCAEIVVG